MALVIRRSSSFAKGAFRFCKQEIRRDANARNGHELTQGHLPVLLRGDSYGPRNQRGCDPIFLGVSPDD